jgi:transcriptional regulator with XRE-family HTH domain
VQQRRSRTSKNKAELQALIELLRDLRLRSQLKQDDLAARLGVPQSYISKYESGERSLDILELRLVCHALNISLSDFAKELEKRISEDEG